MNRHQPARRRGSAAIALLVIGGLLFVGISIGATIAFRQSIRSYYIPSEAMTPALKVGDRVMVETVSYRLHDPRRGDIVVFDAPPEARTSEITQVVQRVVGLPGERIEGRDGRIHIDGKLLDEPYLRASVRSRDFAPVKIPAGSYYVLGDNRLYSNDSTFYGPIEESTIVGRAYLRIWPPNRIAFI